MGKLVAANHDGNEAGDFGRVPGKEGLQVGKSGVEGRAALCERNCGQSDYDECGGRSSPGETAKERTVPAQWLHIGSSVPDGGPK
jgi:hypothetical protein